MTHILLSGSRHIVPLLVAVLYVSCASPPEVEKKMGPPPVPAPFAPNTCQFAGTITEILPVEKAGGKGPCSTVPCLALVRVDRVIGYGSAFGTPIAGGTILRIRFPYTLAPTHALFPAVGDLPPALNKGDSFTATLTSTDAPSTGEQKGNLAANQALEYTLTTYSRTTGPEGVR
jgi:hypothetical protein